MNTEAIYLRLPVPLQHAGASFVGWRTQRTRYGGGFDDLLAEIEGRSFWSEEEVCAFRDGRIAEVVRHCSATVPFYAERFRAIGVDPAAITSLDDLIRLPVLTKSEAQDNVARLRSTKFPSRSVRIAHTSGTTGGALRFPVTMRAIQEQWAVWWRFRGWHGIRRGTWSGLFAGRSVVPIDQTRPPYWRINRPGRQVVFSGYHMSPSNLHEYVDELRRRQLPWLHGYPSLLALLAAYIVDNDIDLGYSVRWVSTGAESLLPHQSVAIERALGVRPIQHYGMAESVANISECEQGKLHVDEDYAAVEFLPTGQDAQHRIVGTTLANLAGPLVRYDTQDLATLGTSATCPCGRPGRVVELIDGRREDYVVLRSGARLGRLDHIFKDMINVREAQIYQAQPGEMTIRVVPRSAWKDTDEQALLGETRKRVGGEMRISIEYVDELERSQIGKLRFVISDVRDASIDQPVSSFTE